MKQTTFENPMGIQTFNHELFGQIRTMTNEQGETFFVGKDVAEALGYAKPQNALAIHVDAEDKTTALIQGTGSNYKTRAVIINESGLYSLILSSQLPSAKAFKRWVTSEVLPQIRRTGGYIPTRDAHTGKALTEEEIVERALGIMQQTIAMQNLPAEGCFTMTQIAEEYGMEARDLCSFLQDLGVIAWRGGRYRLMPPYEQRGYDDERTYCYFTRHGRSRSKPYMVWTPKGKQFVDKMIGAN